MSIWKKLFSEKRSKAVMYYDMCDSIIDEFICREYCLPYKAREVILDILLKNKEEYLEKGTFAINIKRLLVKWDVIITKRIPDMSVLVEELKLDEKD